MGDSEPKGHGVTLAPFLVPLGLALASGPSGRALAPGPDAPWNSAPAAVAILAALLAAVLAAALTLTAVLRARHRGGRAAVRTAALVGSSVPCLAPLAAGLHYAATDTSVGNGGMTAEPI